MSKKLNGNSGCLIEIVNTKNKLTFVRKTSSSEDYNVRLKAQIEKQSLFQKLGFNTPEIIDIGNTPDGKLFFDMEYIPGSKLSELITASLSESIFREFFELLQEIRKLKIHTPSAGSPITKLTALSRQIQSHSICTIALSYLANFDWNNFDIGTCHGDLSLENILAGPKGLVLIDFQDVVLETYLQDYSKLAFDLEFGWSYRNEKKIMHDIQTHGNRMRILSQLESLLESSNAELQIQQFNALKLMNILRILPYAKEEKTSDLLINSIKVTMVRMGIL